MIFELERSFLKLQAQGAAKTSTMPRVLLFDGA
jgi:hypothetical protein